MDKQSDRFNDSDPDERPKNNWRDMLLYFGYDLTRGEDLRRLAKNVEWVDVNREKSERKTSLRPALIVALFTIMGSGFITVLGSWILKTFLHG